MPHNIFSIGFLSYFDFSPSSFAKQLRNKLNQDQSARLQQQRDSLNKRNLEVAAMDRRLVELQERLWKKKAALQQNENQPVSLYRKKISAKVDFYHVIQVVVFFFCTKHLFLLCCCLLNIQDVVLSTD